MKSNERLIAALERAIALNPDAELGKFMRYMASVSDLAYMSDDDISEQMEDYNYFREKYGSEHYSYKFNATDIHYDDRALLNKSDFHKLYGFTKENEQIAYERYKESIKGRVFFPLEERLSLDDFLKRFTLRYVEADDYKEFTVINHRDHFLNEHPVEYKHMHAYTVGKKGDKYVAAHKYAVKFPCFGELLDCITFGFCEGFDECFSIAIDWMESPRFTDYTKHIWYGVAYRPDKREMEIYNTHQTIEMFHDLMQKANKITSTWQGVIYDDGTVG